MAGDPTPDEYDEPFLHEEWGVMVKATGELARRLDERGAVQVVALATGTPIHEAIKVQSWTLREELEKE